ncbi:hypothetical protein [Candidatus Burkholderia verschuerenii]|uniref:hypothetical protein n=1 Tax=Candidatus Burkholderia verschuerenii TaxID=242163 RepID=UPI0018DCE011|nr:hypothetical protein [Candidatus Burkholderia verschuerenii]
MPFGRLSVHEGAWAMSMPIVEPSSGVSEMLGDGLPPNDFPSAPHLYLLLHTRALEDWAYRPSPPDASENLAVAPGVVDLVREISPLTSRRWLWQDLPGEAERGPLLVDVTDDTRTRSTSRTTASSIETRMEKKHRSITID